MFTADLFGSGYFNYNHPIDCQAKIAQCTIFYKKKGNKKDGKNMELTDIQRRLRESIAESGIAQKELARQVGVSPQTISKYMKKDIFPALDTLAKLCKALDVSSDFILGLKAY